jgi:hypothetical protein
VLGQGDAPAPFRDWLARTLAQTIPAGSQGICVGGQLAADVRIAGNHVSGCVQAIHVGLGDQEPRSAGRVQITGNTADVVMPPDTVGERHGVFIGSCQSATVRDNRLDLATGASGRRIEGIRVWGQLGPFLEVVANHITGFPVSANIHAQAPGESKPHWRVADNLFLGATTPLEVTPGVIGIDNQP